MTTWTATTYLNEVLRVLKEERFFTYITPEAVRYIAKCYNDGVAIDECMWLVEQEAWRD